MAVLVTKLNEFYQHTVVMEQEVVQVNTEMDILETYVNGVLAL